MENSKITEVVVYTLKSSSEHEVDYVQKIVKDCLETCDGFVGVRSLQGAKNPLELVDLVSWDSVENASAAQAKFERHPAYPDLMKHLAEMKYSGHFINN